MVKDFYGIEEIDTNFITGLYGRNGFENFINRSIENDKILFADKTKTEELFMFQGLQLPEAFNNLLSDTIIHQSRNIVKRDEEISEKSNEVVRYYSGI